MYFSTLAQPIVRQYEKIDFSRYNPVVSSYLTYDLHKVVDFNSLEITKKNFNFSFYLTAVPGRGNHNSHQKHFDAGFLEALERLAYSIGLLAKGIKGEVVNIQTKNSIECRQMACIWTHNNTVAEWGEIIDPFTKLKIGTCYNNKQGEEVFTLQTEIVFISGF